MTKEARQQLIDKLVSVTIALSELHELVDKNDFLLNLFNNSVITTGALSCSLDELIAEWQTVVNNATLDVASIYECWIKSAKFYRELKVEQKKSMHLEDAGVESNDLVFEDGSYISCSLIKINNAFEIRYYVKLGKECTHFSSSFEKATKYLWDNHSKTGYGI